MPKRCDFVFCEDIRRELGNKVSLMGVYGPIAHMAGASSVYSVAVVCMMYAEYGEDLSKVKVRVGVSLDGGDETKHDLAGLPQSAPSKDKDIGLVAALEKFAPGIDLPVLMLGTMRIAGLKFEKYCELKAYVNGKEKSRMVFVRNLINNQENAAPAPSSGKAVKKERPEKQQKKKAS